MGYLTVGETHSGWKSPIRIASLDDYMRAPKKKSKLSKELQEYEQCNAQDKSFQQETSLETTNHLATSDTSDNDLRLTKAQTTNSATLLQAHKSPPSSPIATISAKPLPKPPLKLAAHPTSTILSTEPLPTDPLACFCTPLLRRYLALIQEPLGSVAAQEQRNLISQQATRDQQRLCQGLDPRSYQAKGKIISIYSCSDVLGWKLGAAIEVIHAPLGFPNQEVWLWEVRTHFKSGMAREGTVVLFRIVWAMQGNHWEVVDVRW